MSDATKDWQPPETQPEKVPGQIVFVRVIQVWRWQPYKPGAPKEFLRRGGRWQRMDGYGGWENVETDDGKIPGEWVIEGDG